MSKRIAPVLQSWLLPRDAVAELRALLAVVRAAERVSADSVGDPGAVENLCALDRALARLSPAKPRPANRRRKP